METRGCEIKHVAVRDNSRLWQLASLVLIEPLAHVRGGCTPGNSRLWQLASLVLIELPAHVRGGCTPGNSRRVAAQDEPRLGQLASLVLIEPLAHVRGVAPLAIRGAWPRRTSRLLAFRKGGSLRKSPVEKRKSF